MTVQKLTVEELLDLGVDDEAGWWIHDPNNEPCPYVGPYPTKAEANDDKRGLEQTWRAWDEPREEELYFEDE